MYTDDGEITEEEEGRAVGQRAEVGGPSSDLGKRFEDEATDSTSSTVVTGFLLGDATIIRAGVNAAATPSFVDTAASSDSFPYRFSNLFRTRSRTLLNIM